MNRENTLRYISLPSYFLHNFCTFVLFFGYVYTLVFFDVMPCSLALYLSARQDAPP